MLCLQLKAQISKDKMIRFIPFFSSYENHNSTRETDGGLIKETDNNIVLILTLRCMELISVFCTFASLRKRQRVDWDKYTVSERFCVNIPNLYDK